MAAAIKFLSPKRIRGSLTRPVDFLETSVFYLQYGRNTWHSTWSERFYTSEFSYGLDVLKLAAERLRERGTVFSIHQTPLFVFRYRRRVLGFCPINDASLSRYCDLHTAIETATNSTFWRQIPDLERRWIALLKLGRKVPRCPYNRIHQTSFTRGPGLKLGWRDSDIPSPEWAEFRALGRLVTERLMSVDPLPKEHNAGSLLTPDSKVEPI